MPRSSSSILTGITRPGRRQIVTTRQGQPGRSISSKSGKSSPSGRRAALASPGEPQAQLDHSVLHIRNRVIGEVWGPQGRKAFVRKRRFQHDGNIMLTYGLDKLASMLATDSNGASNWCIAGAIGTSTTAAASTQDSLSASTQIVYASQASMVFSRFGARTWQAAMTFASNGQAAQINEVGLFATNAATVSGVARTVLGTDSINRGTADEIRVSYQVILSTA